MKKFLLILLFPFFLSQETYAQIGIGTPVPDASAQLDVSSDDKGLLIPRLTAAARGLIPSPANGLLVYQTDEQKGFYFRQDGAWVKLPDAKSTGLISFSSGTRLALSTYGPNAVVLGFGHSLPIGVWQSGLITSSGEIAASIPKSGIIEAVSASFKISAGNSGSSVRARFYISSSGGDFTEITPAQITLTHDGNGVADGKTLSTTLSGLNIPVNAGDRLALVIDLPGNIVLSGYASAGVSLVY